MFEVNDAEIKGMKAICDYVGFSESTVLIWIRDRDFPAKRINGEWISSEGAVEKWMQETGIEKKGKSPPRRSTEARFPRW
jgi:predicted DNA-binding transcriptional regulator AlpA